MTMLVVFLVGFLGLASAGKHDIYAGYTVHGVVIDSLAAQHLLHQLESDFDLDTLQDGAPPDRDAYIMVTPGNNEAFLKKLDENGVKHYVVESNVPRSLEEFDADMMRFHRSRAGREAQPFEYYPRHDEVNEYLEKIAAEYPDLVSLVTAGPSYDGREIKYVKISTTNFEDASKPIYFMDAMIHAREWVTTPVSLYSIHRLVVDRREEDEDLLEGTDWIIYPVVNPDGYEFSHTDERLWRRTRSTNPNPDTECRGADGNRNFDVAFNTTTGVSSNPCSQQYVGAGPFSEVETRYIRDVLHEYLPRIQVYLNIHSHGNWVLFGFGNRTLPANGVQLHHVGAVMGAAIDAVKLPQAPFYRVGNSAMLLYPTSGSAQDYAQHIGVPFSYTLELPGYSYAFQVPVTYIGQITSETWVGIAAQARLAKLHYNDRIRT
ncbi:carboxypeptidase B-like [Pectinophora gossypiella]|uniref:carboxypeptidase B-like n=1 Tax=Pectinophora gossypiella TaxID=13191 RepID=UPI00214F0EB7|nr:carboxypeptidase B-like [Pectinophora gossypiella]